MLQPYLPVLLLLGFVINAALWALVLALLLVAFSREDTL